VAGKSSNNCILNNTLKNEVLRENIKYLYYMKLKSQVIEKLWDAGKGHLKGNLEQWVDILE
jgi:hypothetical protein